MNEFAILWALGIGAIWAGAWYLAGRHDERKRQEKEREKDEHEDLYNRA